MCYKLLQIHIPPRRFGALLEMLQTASLEVSQSGSTPTESPAAQWGSAARGATRPWPPRRVHRRCPPGGRWVSVAATGWESQATRSDPPISCGPEASELGWTAWHWTWYVSDRFRSPSLTRYIPSLPRVYPLKAFRPSDKSPLVA